MRQLLLGSMFVVVATTASAALTTACGGTDPNTLYGGGRGGPGGNNGAEDPSVSADPTNPDGTTANAASGGPAASSSGSSGSSGSSTGGVPPGGCAAGAQLFTADVFTAVNPSCGSCHGPAGAAAKFMGADAATTYPLFLARGYQVANSTFVSKGVHSGPALTTTQRASVDKWIAAEAACAADAGTPPPPPPPPATNAFTGAAAFTSKIGQSARKDDHPWANGNPKGQDCSNCHNFFAGGTVFTTAAGTTPAAGVEVRIRDAAGNAVSAWTDQDGNFYIKKSGGVALPALVGARNATTNALMGATISDGGCASASCHVAGKAGPVHM
jgi:mono/diheme cytochrome c family protein